MENCLPDVSYSATKATNLLNDDTYNEKKIFFWNQNSGQLI